jgi:hypothetical protein
MKKLTAVCIMAMMVCMTVNASEKKLSAKEQKEKAAVTAAEATLKLIDGEKYAESWKASANFFQKAVKQEQWVAAMTASRKPLGKMVSRKVAGKKYMTNLPNAPKGEYVVIQFKTSFANKKSAIETFTPILAKDGKWKMTGYYIK